MGGYRNKTTDTAEYVDSHRAVIDNFMREISRHITYRIGGAEAQTITKLLMERSYKHDMDKLRFERTLELYAHRDELRTEEMRAEYKARHKLINRHHPEFYTKDANDKMGFVDYIEFAADIYSSTYLRGKKPWAELLEEQELANFSDEDLNAILMTYGSMNASFRYETSKKFPNLLAGSTPDIVDVLNKKIIDNTITRYNYINIPKEKMSDEREI